LITVSMAELLAGDTVTLTLTALDAGGNIVPSGGAVVAFAAAGGTSQGEIGSVADNGDGTYDADYVASGAGSEVTIGASLDGAAVSGSSVSMRVVAFTSIAPGGTGGVFGAFTCGVLTSEDMYCWGSGVMGTIGDGVIHSTDDLVLTPVRVSGDHDWSASAAGRHHVCAITSAGNIFCWGLGSTGQLGHGSWGNGSTDNRNSPTQVVGDHVFSSFSTGADATCGVATGNTGYCWGINTYGRLGTGSWSSLPDGSTEQYGSPTAITSGLELASVGIGQYHACGITTIGAAHCWGYGAAVGIGSTPFPNMCGSVECAHSPMEVVGGVVFDPGTMVAGSNHSCALTTGGEAYCWGTNSYGALGDGTSVNSASPVAVPGGVEFGGLSAGNEFTCGVSSAGMGYCWGHNDTGQLGNGTTTDAATPQTLSGTESYSIISAGRSHACAISRSGVAYCWGNNDYGQLGDRSTTASLVPVRVALFRD
jgi:alpha-tubulin suppressor-like RCC1 family protein